MATGDKLSQTMRIDLIPDVPAQPVPGRKKQVMIAPPTQRHKRVPIQGARPVEGGGEDARFKELLQSIYDAALICDLSGRIDEANVRAIEFLHYTREELCNMLVSEVIAGADDKLLRMLWDNLENERFTLIQAYCVRKDGSYFPAEISVNKLSIGQVQLCFFIRDTTLRRQEQEMLRTEHNAIQNAGNGIAVVNLATQLEYVNPAVATMWGYSNQDALLGQDVRMLLSDGSVAEEMIRTSMQDGKPWSDEVTAKRPDGTEFDLQISAVCNRNSDGETIGIVFSFVDISDRKRAEVAMREAERQRVMLESLGAACHHLGQPATVLLANLGIIHKRWHIEDEMVKDLVESSIKAAETLGEILHKLNTVNEYRTTQYLKKAEGSDAPENRILEI
ncbi:MAG: hypothetical protein C0404_11530 [Verrucomicrobia bacterium]|nr:hypothetical protein [Verrucomicrobiota bacterium]